MSDNAAEVIQANGQTSLYRAVWRWHFYAGLLTLPFLVLLAVTGGIYLFKPELERMIYRDMIETPVRNAAPVAPSIAQARIEQATTGSVLQMILPAKPGDSIGAIVRLPSGEPRTVYADPYDGHLLGSLPYGGLMQTIRQIHSLKLLGFWASSLIEIAAGWAIVMAGTGIFLWWPRGAKGGVVSVRGSPAKRIFWRDFHAVTGAFAGLAIIFLAVTGMPWSLFWGNTVQRWATEANLTTPAPPAKVTPVFLLGVPAAPTAVDAHAGHAGHDMPKMTPWALEKATPPSAQSDPRQADIGIDRAVARFEELGVPRPFGVQPPEGPQGAYVASYQPEDVGQVRTVYLDPRSGEVLGDVGFAQYGPASKAIEWGIAVHQGQQYGPINRYLMLAACVAIVLLAVTSVVMWWKRRPKGKIGVPPLPQTKRAVRGVLAIMIVAGLIFPLMGASLLVAVALDWIANRVLASKSSAVG